MTTSQIEHDVTIWMADDIPARMFYAGRRWRVTNVPTRLRESIWAMPLDRGRGMYGWRFQATSDTGDTLVFDVYRDGEDWHVHHTYT